MGDHMNLLWKKPLTEREKMLEKLISAKEREIAAAPDGKVYISWKGKQARYYYRADPRDCHRRYVPREQHHLVKALVQKEYDQKVLAAAKKELYLIRQLAGRYELGCAEDVYAKLPQAKQQLVDPIDLSDEEYAAVWQSETYQGKTISDEAREYDTERGERVRSKSELIIADTLNRMGVPYHYEKPLKLQGIGIIHPDFTVLNVRKRKTMFWEHLGMMDDADYLEHALVRINAYIDEGYYPGDSLLITHETAARPLGTKRIGRVIQHYLL